MEVNNLDDCWCFDFNEVKRLDEDFLHFLLKPFENFKTDDNVEEPSPRSECNDLEEETKTSSNNSTSEQFRDRLGNE